MDETREVELGPIWQEEEEEEEREEGSVDRLNRAWGAEQVQKEERGKKIMEAFDYIVAVAAA